MNQLSLFGGEYNDCVVNVASVPQRSPFRYPGGKTWLVPKIRKWLKSFSHAPEIFIEPFAGGGIVSLTAAFENLSKNVMMVELDDQVAAVWKTILSDEAEWLANQILLFDLSIENVKTILNKETDSLKEKAFQTLLKNRVYHGGILAQGSGLIKFGENGKGIKSRWYPQTLSRRILNITAIKERICFINGDGINIMNENSHKKKAVFFIDPPYTAAGKKAGRRLYTHNVLDHENLFLLAGKIAGDFLMTYDNNDRIVEMAIHHGFDTEVIPMKNTHNTKMTELLIGKDLGWCR
jgi:DNA adenine methylase